MKATISANLQHAQLLDYSGRRNGSRTSAGSSIDKEMAAQQALLRERGSLHAATSRVWILVLNCLRSCYLASTSPRSVPDCSMKYFPGNLPH